MFYSEKLIFKREGRSNFRIPSMIVTNNGTILAFCNDRKDTLADDASEVALSMCKKAPGEDWSEVRDLAAIPGWACTIGSAVYDAEIGRVFVFGGRSPISVNEYKKYTEEEMAAIRKKQQEMIAEMEAKGVNTGGLLFHSDDNGETWAEEKVTVNPIMQHHFDGKDYSVSGHTHGSAHGIQLRHGEHKGRLLCPSRFSIGKYHDMIEIRNCVYNNSIYSDDHGKTWQASTAVQLGTGEGTLIENADGSITFNSRAYFANQKRYLATSTDGGATYHDFRADDFLIEEKAIGCNASFIRVELDDIKDKSALPEGAKDVTVFCNPRAETRDNMCACVSFDSGKTWSHVKVINPGHAAYSSLVFDPVSQHFMLIYENGAEHSYSDGISAAEFDLEWLLSE